MPAPAEHPRPQRDEDAAAHFAERFAAELTGASTQRMAARVFATLLVSDSGALTSAELAERLRISPASVSGAIRQLTQMRLASRERDPGSRRERYRLNEELWMEAFTGREQQLLGWTRMLAEASRRLGTDTPAGMRLAETAAFFRYLRSSYAETIARWHERREELIREEVRKLS
ncbi:GbsR/MarR family transcriptional regulator [Streptomyces gamaensis]|uniref:GbsR/MarR family transcriptional regulator n=1 Tax=Streptomyces gamaensis TaxID=1763542 RepID=A0ABW0YWA0_9ACTN